MPRNIKPVFNEEEFDVPDVKEILQETNIQPSFEGTIERANAAQTNSDAVNALNKSTDELSTTNTRIFSFTHEISVLTTLVSTVIPALKAACKIEFADDAKKRLQDESERQVRSLMDELDKHFQGYLKQLHNQQKRISLSPIAFYCLAAVFFCQSIFFGVMVFANFYLWQDSRIWTLIITVLVMCILVISAIVFVNNRFSKDDR